MASRHCPQCFKGYETKQAYVEHMVDDWQHRYSKAAALRAWKAADAKACAEELTERMAALGMVLCHGCSSAINPATSVHDERISKYSEPRYFCGACYRRLPELGAWLVRENGTYGYGYMHDDGERSGGVSGMDSMEAAERCLRKHLAQFRMSEQNDWLGAIEIIENPADLKEHLGYVAWQKAARQLGYTTHDCKFGDERFAAFTETERTIEQTLRAQYLGA